MATVKNGVIYVNGMPVGTVSQYKGNIKDGSVINIDYPKGNRVVEL